MIARDTPETLATRSSRSSRASHLWRRVRGCLGIGVFWGGLGAFVGGAISAGYFLLGDWSQNIVEAIAWAGGFGFGMGCGFSALLLAVEGRRPMDRLSAWRSALWGGLVGACTPIVLLAGLLLIYAPDEPFWRTLVAELMNPGADFFWMSSILGSLGSAMAGVTTLIAKHPTRRLSLRRGAGLLHSEDPDLLEGGA